MKEQRIVQQLDKMVDSGRLTADEAERLRAAEGTPEFERAIGEIRARHASVQLESAVRSGQISQDEAEEQLRRLRSGEHPKGLRERLRKHRNASAE
jgi:hypothetical protein